MPCGASPHGTTDRDLSATISRRLGNVPPLTEVNVRLFQNCVRVVFPALLFGVFSAQGLMASDLTFYVGGINPGNLHSGARQVNLDGGAVYGFRLNMNFIPTVGLEQTFGFSSNFLAPSGLPDGQDSNGFIYSANVIVNFPLKNFTPYATAGAGLIWQHGSDNLPVGGEFALNYGGGIKWKLFGPTGLRFDARGYSTTKVYDNSLNMFELSAGFFVKF